jgi:hypothetical protein
MKTSEILIEAKAQIADPEHWSNEGWALIPLPYAPHIFKNADEIFSVQELLDADRVCAVTATARVCIREGLWFPELGEGHSCDCDHCDANGEELSADTALNDFRHEALDLLNGASERLYSKPIIEVNDDKEQHTHAEVMLAYDLAIATAQFRESVQD